MKTQEIKEVLISNCITYDNLESQDRAFIYVDDFTNELQEVIKSYNKKQIINFMKWYLKIDTKKHESLNELVSRYIEENL